MENELYRISRAKACGDAAELLGMMGLVLIPEGEPFPTGIAGEQDPAPGTRLPPWWAGKG